MRRAYPCRPRTLCPNNTVLNVRSRVAGAVSVAAVADSPAGIGSYNVVVVPTVEDRGRVLAVGRAHRIDASRAQMGERAPLLILA